MCATRVIATKHVTAPTKARYNRAKKFFDGLATKLGYNHLDDWYNISSEIIHKHRGENILKYYNQSPSLALQNAYPQHTWKSWRFQTVPRGCWNHMVNRKELFDWIFAQLGYKQMDDWYQVTKELIFKHGGRSL